MTAAALSVPYTVPTGHGFFNRPPFFQRTLAEMERFLGETLGATE